jgi:uncharacterized protein YbjT (DUF2867 family)
MKVLITGGTGNLGRAVQQSAKAAGNTVRILSRRQQPDSTRNDLEWVQGDLSSGDGVGQAVTGVDAILHLASDPRRSREVDVEGTRQLVDAARATHVPHFVYISIVGIDKIPYSYYQRKLEAEEIIKSSCLPHSILRATQFHSLIDMFLSLLGRVPLVLPLPTDFKFQSVAESEVATRLVQQLGKGPAGMMVEMGGPEILTAGEMAKIWMNVKAIGKRLIHLPLPGTVAAGFRAGKNTTPNGIRGSIGWRQWLMEVRQV